MAELYKYLPGRYCIQTYYRAKCNLSLMDIQIIIGIIDDVLDIAECCEEKDFWSNTAVKQKYLDLEMFKTCTDPIVSFSKFITLLSSLFFTFYEDGKRYSIRLLDGYEITHYENTEHGYGPTECLITINEEWIKRWVEEERGISLDD